MRRAAALLAIALLVGLVPRPAGAAPDPLAAAFSNALRYNLTVWYPTAPEIPRRSSATVAYATAIALTTGGFDASAVGTTAAAARTVARSLAVRLARTHRANGGVWGYNWESAYWTFMAGTAARLLDVRGDDWTLVRRMVAAEADYALARPARYYADRNGRILTPGNSGAEEVAWDRTVLAFAAQIVGGPHAGAWRARAARDRIVALARPADLPVIGWLAGTNVDDDGTFPNHGKISPHYMAVALALTAQARPARPRNGRLVYRALTRYYRPDGTVASPGGDDWGTAIVTPYVTADRVAARYGYPGARHWLALHLGRLLRLQARSDDGRTYVGGLDARPSEDHYPGREQVVAGDLATAWLTAHPDPTVPSAP